MAKLRLDRGMWEEMPEHLRIRVMVYAILHSRCAHLDAREMLVVSDAQSDNERGQQPVGRLSWILLRDGGA